MPRRSTTARTLLCVCNFPSNTGYAWDFIEGLYAKTADRLTTHGARTLVAYPAVPEAPRPLVGSAASAVEFDFNLSARGLLRALAFVRRENVRTIYLTDRPSVSPAYVLLRLAGARRIVVHDHVSGEFTAPTGLKRFLKWSYARIPGFAADVIIGVSDFVANRQVEVNLAPRARVVRIWNGVPLPSTSDDSGALREIVPLRPGQPVIVCCCRASHVKGVAHLLGAFERVWRAVRESPGGILPALVYIGDGPQFDELMRLRSELESKADVHFLGFQRNASGLLAGADLCVVPSVWHEACPLGVLEPMAQGKPLVATEVGGTPELVDFGSCGMLVPSEDEAALSAALLTLMDDRTLANRLGAAARDRIARHFRPESQIDALVEILSREFEKPGV